MQATPRDPFSEPRRAEWLLLHACLEDKFCVVHRQRVSFSVEHPVLEGEHIIFREQKIEIPRTRRKTKKSLLGETVRYNLFMAYVRLATLVGLGLD